MLNYRMLALVVLLACLAGGLLAHDRAEAKSTSFHDVTPLLTIPPTPTATSTGTPTAVTTSQPVVEVRTLPGYLTTAGASQTDSNLGIVVYDPRDPVPTLLAVSFGTMVRTCGIQGLQSYHDSRVVASGGVIRQVDTSGTWDGALKVVMPDDCPTYVPAPGILTDPRAKPLSWYPRPTNDTGFGMHWSARMIDENTHPTVVDAFMRDLSQMGISWLKVLTYYKQPNYAHEHLLQRARELDMQVVVRIYSEHNDAMDGPAIVDIVKWYTARGVRYFEVYNEPNLIGPDGGWWDLNPITQDNINFIVDRWMDAAEVIQAHGGIPLFPAMSPGGSFDDVAFEELAFRQLAQAPNERGLNIFRRGAAIALHNYGLNHPLCHPEDRPLGTLQPGDDTNGFRKYEAYRALFVRYFHFDVPIIGTEGGWIPDSKAPDNRFQAVNEQLHAQLSVEALKFMLEEAPAYFFVHMNWIMTDGLTPGWYRDGNPQSKRLVVDALRQAVDGRVLNRTHHP